MSGKVRYWSLIGLLAAGVTTAVSASITAQAPGSSPAPQERGGRGPDQPATGGSRELMWFDGRGSRLGVMVQDLDPAQRGDGGVRIDAVDGDSPADKAGLRAGDIVVEYDGERVRSARQFTRLVRETPEGVAVPLAVMRDGQRQTLTATPEARAFSWNVDIDRDRIRRDVERGLESLREFRMDVPPMRFHFDGGFAPMGSRRLGVSLDSLSDQLAQYFGASSGGALVTSVEKGSAAEKAGLKAGDVITSINGTQVRDAGQVADALRGVESGEVTVGYLRDRKPETAKATVEPRADSGRTGRGESRRRGVRPAAASMRPA